MHGHVFQPQQVTLSNYYYLLSCYFKCFNLDHKPDNALINLLSQHTT